MGSKIQVDRTANSEKDATFGRWLAGWYHLKLEGVRISVPKKSEQTSNRKIVQI